MNPISENTAFTEEPSAEEIDRLDSEIAQYESGDLVPDWPEESNVATFTPAPSAVNAMYQVAKNALARRVFNARELAAQYPPRIASHNKRIVYNRACPKGADSLAGRIVASRWQAIQLPLTFAGSMSGEQKDQHEHGAGCLLQYKENVFTYDPPQSQGNEAAPIEWHVNFADKHVFGYYGGSLFAQDEMQVAEHPALASLREALVELKDEKLQPLTTDHNGHETPILVMGVERRVTVATDKNRELGRPAGLYGNMFSMAPEQAIEQATRAIDPPTISNIIAMEAPKYGHGTYSPSEITQILRTAYTAFLSARVESYLAAGAMTEDESKKPNDPVFPRVIIHTGNWGTGAYGGNKILMALLQMAAARLALGDGDTLLYHTFAPPFTAAYHEAEKHLRHFLAPSPEPVAVSAFINKVFALKLRWGQSDGN